MDIVKERSTRYLSIEFRDRNGMLAAPTAVTYRIDCRTTGTQVRQWTSVPPGQSIEIVLTPDDNAIFGGDAHEREVRHVTIVAAYGPNNTDQATDDYEYAVRNLRFLS
jgi:hypothetical protein